MKVRGILLYFDFVETCMNTFTPDHESTLIDNTLYFGVLSGKPYR
jgi:hypothetical protein